MFQKNKGEPMKWVPKFKSYDGGKQPAEENANEHAESQVVKEHGPARSVTVRHGEGTHSLRSTHKDGYENMSEHDSAKSAYDSAAKLALEEGGKLQAADSKRRDHPDQQSSPAEEDGFEMAPLA